MNVKDRAEAIVDIVEIVATLTPLQLAFVRGLVTGMESTTSKPAKE